MSVRGYVSFLFIFLMGNQILFRTYNKHFFFSYIIDISIDKDIID